MSVLELDALTVDYAPATRVLDEVSLRVRPGEVVGVVGESGSGKTTLARSILRSLPTHSTRVGGRICVGGADISRLRGRALRAWRRSGQVQYVYQDPLRSLDPGIRVGESIVEGLRIARLPEREVIARRTEALERTGLDEALLSRLPGALSGGQRQRVAIARALVTRPRLLLLDEPVSALDAAGRDHVIRSLIALRDAAGKSLAMIVISHDIGSLAAMSDRLVVLCEGLLVEDGPTRRVITAPTHDYTRRLIDSVPVIGTGTANRPALM